MASTINALSTGSGGLVSTGDASGQLELQANGSTKLTVSSAGVNIAGGIASPLIVTGNSTAGAELRLPEDTDNGSNYVALKAADSIASNLTFTLPSADGTSGQVLQTNGSGTLSFATPAAGALTFISSQTVSGSVSQVDFTSGINSTYDDYLMLYEGVIGPTQPAIRVQKSGNFQTANYNTLGIQGVAGGPNMSGGAAEASLAVSNANGISSSNISFGWVYLLNANDTTGKTGLMLNGGSFGSSSPANYMNMSGGCQTTSAATTGIRFYDQASNAITAGTFRLYGIQKS